VSRFTPAHQGFKVTIDRMDAKIAKKMMNIIISSPERFCPVQPRTPDLKSTKSQDTEILFIDTGNRKLRLEADIDNANILEQKDGSHLKWVGQYQMGTTSCFEDNTRNKRAEVIAVDIERGIDWNLEIITDGSVKQIHPDLLSLVRGSVTGETATLVRGFSSSIEFCDAIISRFFPKRL
jgi:hypothetical protein